MALLRSKPRYLLDTEAYLFDETFNDPTGLLSDTPTAAAAPVAAAPAPAPAAAPAPVAAPAPAAPPAPAFTLGTTPAADDPLRNYWAWNDPRWGGQELDYLDRQYRLDQFWNPLLESTGFDMSKALRPSGKMVSYGEGGQEWEGQEYTPEYYKAIDDLRAQGYDIRQENPDLWSPSKDAKFAVIGPGNKILKDITVAGSNYGDFLKEAVAFLGPALAGAYLPGLLGGAGGAAAGIAEGMVPGGLASVGIPATAAELAAVSSIAGAPLAGAGLPSADLYADLADAGLYESSMPPADLYSDLASTPPTPETPTPSAPPSESFRPSQNYGPGMSGTQTSVYDSVLNTTGNKAVADLFSNAVGSGTSVLDWVKENPTAGRALFSAAGALLNTAGGGGSGGSGGYVDSGYRPTISRGGFNAAPQARQMPLSPVGLLSTPAQGQAMSGLWRYGLLGG